MKSSEILSSSNPRILRNGKIVISKKKNMTKKKSVLKMKNDNQLCLLKTSQSDLSTLLVENKNNSHEIMVPSSYNRVLDNRGLYILLKRLSLPLIIYHKITLDDQINNNSNTNCYKNLENYIDLNELQIYNEPKPKKIIKSEPVTKNKTISNLDTNQNVDVRITRGQKIKLQNEERKQLNQKIFNKFPKNTFKLSVIKLNDISEEAKFLRTLGLTCRFKSPFTTYNLKKKHF